MCVTVAVAASTAADRTVAGTDPICGGQPVTQHEIIPLLHLRCTVCHGARKREADLDLRTKASMLKGGKSGPAIVLGQPDGSLLLKRIRAGEMPPRKRLVEASVKTMQPQEMKLLAAWIAQGAPEVSIKTAADQFDKPITDADRRFWAFSTPQKPAVPQVRNAVAVRNPIDAFLARVLEAEGLSFSPAASRAVLLRRVSLDLTGLPPAPEEVRKFLRDDSPDAFEKLVDRLLASPRYGERWARYWLDVAGYADSEGVTHQDSVRPHAWRYRDYVIRTFNNDKPYDRFLLEQIAGDELADYENAPAITQELYDNLVATGFLRMAPDGTWANITNFVPDRLAVINDEIEILSSAVMGLTFKCARCHPHKFDPLSQRDFFRLRAVLKPAYDEHDWLKPYAANQFSSGPFGLRFLPYVTSEERARWEAHENLLKTEIDKLKTEAKDKNEEDAKRIQERIKSLEGRRKPQPMIRALWDRGEPTPTHLLKRGNYLTPGPLVEPGIPAAFDDGTELFPARPASSTPAVRNSRGAAKPASTETKTTGRRLAFAKWLVNPNHPLTARVMVNRIWKHHFGHGLVRTLDNFGKTGSPPSHPQLLDWLAVEFVNSGWSVKHMQRLMMFSTAYRQSSAVFAVHERKDPENRLLSRMPLKRIDAESLRDLFLSISGRLDSAAFGPPDAVTVRGDGLVTVNVSPRGWRRSIYIQQRRTQIPTILENFDLPQMGPNCIERPESTVAPQALHLMNNKTVHALSQAFARRVINEAGRNPQQQIERVYLIALSRRPSNEEQEVALARLGLMKSAWKKSLKAAGDQLATSTEEIDSRAGAHALANLCHAIMNSAALLYVD